MGLQQVPLKYFVTPCVMQKQMSYPLFSLFLCSLQVRNLSCHLGVMSNRLQVNKMHISVRQPSKDRVVAMEWEKTLPALEGSWKIDGRFRNLSFEMGNKIFMAANAITETNWSLQLVRTKQKENLSWHKIILMQWKTCLQILFNRDCAGREHRNIV